MNYKYYCITDKGPVREINEDSLLYENTLINQVDRFVLDQEQEGSITEKPVWFAVADGMGGHESGEVASGFVLERLKELFQKEGKQFLTEPESLSKEIKRLHLDLDVYALNIGKTGMGTTLVGVLLNRAGCHLFNVGDSRIYLHRNGYLQQKTRDHSFKEQTGLDVAKNYITSCMGGGSNDIIIDLYDLSEQVKPGDLMLICSDGLTDFDLMDAYDTFENIIEENKDDLSQLSHKLLQFSLEKGASDNIALIVIRFF